MRAAPSITDYVPTTLTIATIQPLTYDEPVWSLYERNVLVNNGKALHRVQAIRVIRGGRLVEFTHDMGPASNWAAGGFAVMSILEDSVGQVMEAADFMRGDGDKGLDAAMEEHAAEENVILNAIERATQIQTFLRQNPRTARSLRLQKPREGRTLLHAVTAPQGKA